MQISLEVVPWLTRAFGHSGSGRFITSLNLEEHTSVSDLLLRLTREHLEFASYALEDEALSCPHICLLLNGRILAIPSQLPLPLRDGDMLVLLPAFSGGGSYTRTSAR